MESSSSLQSIEIFQSEQLNAQKPNQFYHRKNCYISDLNEDSIVVVVEIMSDMLICTKNLCKTLCADSAVLKQQNKLIPC